MIEGMCAVTSGAFRFMFAWEFLIDVVVLALPALFAVLFSTVVIAASTTSNSIPVARRVAVVRKTAMTHFEYGFIVPPFRSDLGPAHIPSFFEEFVD
jgi:hypothetical protein